MRNAKNVGGSPIYGQLSTLDCPMAHPFLSLFNKLIPAASSTSAMSTAQQASLFPPLSSFPPKVQLAFSRLLMQLELSRLRTALAETHNSSEQQHSSAIVPYEPITPIIDSYQEPNADGQFAITVESPATYHSSPSTPSFLPLHSDIQLMICRPTVRPNAGLAHYFDLIWPRFSAPNGPRLYVYNDFDIETQRFLLVHHNNQNGGADPPPPTRHTSLGKTFLALTFQAALSLMGFYYPNLLSTPTPSPPSPPSSSSSPSGSKSPISPPPPPPPPPLLLHIVFVAMVVGFAGCWSGLLLRTAYPATASIIEKMGSMSASLGFFVMATMVLPWFCGWIGWFAATVSMLAFGRSLVKIK